MPTERARQRTAVSNAIRRGKMPPANLHACEDCGAGATMYAHVGPGLLDVRPVCFACRKRQLKREQASG